MRQCQFKAQTRCEGKYLFGNQLNMELCQLVVCVLGMQLAIRRWMSRVAWLKLLSSTQVIQRHNFISCLALLDRMSTKDRQIQSYLLTLLNDAKTTLYHESHSGVNRKQALKLQATGHIILLCCVYSFTGGNYDDQIHDVPENRLPITS